MLLLFTQLSLKAEFSEVKDAGTKNRVLHEIATQGHSRSFTLQFVSGLKPKTNSSLCCYVSLKLMLMAR